MSNDLISFAFVVSCKFQRYIEFTIIKQYVIYSNFWEILKNAYVCNETQFPQQEGRISVLKVQRKL